MQKTPTRPVYITVMCIIMTLISFGGMLYTFTGANAHLGMFYPAIRVIWVISLLASISGIWSMEKWGMWLYLASIAGIIGTDLYVGAFQGAEILLLLPWAGFFFFRKKFQ